MPDFCSCEIGKQKRAEFTVLPKQQEALKNWKLERIERLLKKSQVGPRFKEKTIEDLADNKPLQKLCTDYVARYKEFAPLGWGLYMWGNVGAGKTHAATALCNELIKTHMTEILFVNMSDASNRVRSTFDDNDKTDSDLFEEMKKVELLVIDDIGVEKVTEWLSEQLFLVINHRYENKLPMIITSNQSLEDLGQLHKPQIASRLDEMCKSVKFAGIDRRQNFRPYF